MYFISCRTAHYRLPVIRLIVHHLQSIIRLHGTPCFKTVPVYQASERGEAGSNGTGTFSCLRRRTPRSVPGTLTNYGSERGEAGSNGAGSFSRLRRRTPRSVTHSERFFFFVHREQTKQGREAGRHPRAFFRGSRGRTRPKRPQQHTIAGQKKAGTVFQYRL